MRILWPVPEEAAAVAAGRLSAEGRFIAGEPSSSASAAVAAAAASRSAAGSSSSAPARFGLGSSGTKAAGRFLGVCLAVPFAFAFPLAFAFAFCSGISSSWYEKWIALKIIDLVLDVNTRALLPFQCHFNKTKSNSPCPHCPRQWSQAAAHSLLT